jgi:glutamyl-tRNA synthetase
MQLLSEAEGMLGFLLVDDDAFGVDPDDAAKALTADAVPVLQASVRALADVPTWDTASIETALRAALVDGLGLKPKHAFAPVRVAVTGRRVSPPLFESLELLGRERSLRRLRDGLAAAGG